MTLREYRRCAHENTIIVRQASREDIGDIGDQSFTTAVPIVSGDG